jgi:hypothetical protein
MISNQYQSFELSCIRINSLSNAALGFLLAPWTHTQAAPATAPLLKLESTLCPLDTHSARNAPQKASPAPVASITLEGCGKFTFKVKFDKYALRPLNEYSPQKFLGNPDQSKHKRQMRLLNFWL